jgi:hypothetical protein
MRYKYNRQYGNKETLNQAFITPLVDKKINSRMKGHGQLAKGHKIREESTSIGYCHLELHVSKK